MTDKGYDPFSYGQLRMNQGAATGATGAEPRAAREEAPEDILFTPSAATPAAASSYDSSWDPPAEPVNEFQGDFGADVLGERGGGKAVVKPKPAVARPAAQPATQPAAKVEPTRAAPSRVQPAGEAGEARPAPRPAAKPRVVPAVVPIMAPSRGGIVVVAPLLIVLAGGAGAAWLHFGRQNTVMAGIAAALSLAIGGIAWFGLRR